MKKKIVSLMLAGCLFGGSVTVTANAAEVEGTEAAVEATVEIADEATPLAGEFAAEEVVEVEVVSEEPAAEVEVTEDVVAEDVPVEFDITEETSSEDSEEVKVEAEDLAETEKVEITPLEEKEEDNVIVNEIKDAEAEKEATAEVEKKVVSKLSTIYTQGENGVVLKTTKSVVVDEDGNESVEEETEEYGYVAEDGKFYILSKEMKQDVTFEINVEYVKDIQKIMPWDEDASTENFASFTITDEIVSADLAYTTVITEDQDTSALEIGDSSVNAIIEKVNLPEKLETGVDITAHVDENGKITEITAVATEPTVREYETTVSELAEMDFEFDKEYVEDEVAVEILDEETPLAGDMDAEDEESEDKESEDEEPAEEVIKKVEATKEVAVVEELDEADSDDEADEVADEVIDEAEDTVIEEAVVEETVAEETVEEAPVETSAETVEAVEAE